jgi:aspartyl-tRNA(Asn)/glutamyl-tRNA(Gln) amidotransferase subunit B
LTGSTTPKIWASKNSVNRLMSCRFTTQKGYNVAEEKSILDRYPDYEVVIGMEVHVQLITNSKIFCTCPNQITTQPNSNICHICAGHPGVLPVLNKKVVEHAIKAGLATNCQITKKTGFDRKHYFYPDLPKGYQITQNDRPICTEGYIPVVKEDGSIKNIRLNRIHIEEDAGKNIHASGSDESFVDLNRAGTPLLEIVSYPDISNIHEQRSYLKSLRSIVQYLGICSGNMEDGAFRADTNISVRKKGATVLGTKCELKNINSFKFISDATEHEIERQILLLEDGGKVRQETRLWDTKNRKTVVMRVKEEAADYRYFPEPDLPDVHISDEMIESMKAQMPELPTQKFERLQKEYNLSAYEAGILIEDRPVSAYFEEAAQHSRSKHLINWLLRDVMGYAKEAKIELSEAKITPAKLAQLVELIEKGTINNRAAKEVFDIVARDGSDPETVVKEKGLEQMQSTGEVEEVIKALVTQHPDLVAEYKAGKERVLPFFIGQVMKQTKGKGNPQVVQELLKKYLMQ